MTWVEVTEDQARQHPSYGFGVWLWVFYVVELFVLSIMLYWVLDVVRLIGPADLTEPSMAMVWIAWGGVTVGCLLQSRRVNVTYRHRVHAAEAASPASEALQA